MTASTTLPEIRIQYGWLLSDAASVHLNEQFGDGTPLRTYDEYVEIAVRYEDWWRPYNDRILQGLCDILSLAYRPNVIDVYVAPWFNAISLPLVVGPAFKTQDEFIVTLAHELTHRLLADNTTTDYFYNPTPDWEASFGSHHAVNCLIHIPIHACLKQLYIDVLKRPELVELDQQAVKDSPDYVAAWKYVDEHDYNTIVTQVTASIQNYMHA
jgi:hypothetical protein